MNTDSHLGHPLECEPSNLALKLRAHHIELLSHQLPSEYSLYISMDNPDPREYLEKLRNSPDFARKTAERLAKDFVRYREMEASMNSSRTDYVTEVIGTSAVDRQSVGQVYALILRRLFSLPEGEEVYLSTTPDLICSMCSASSDSDFAPHCNEVTSKVGDLMYIDSIRNIRELISRTIRWASAEYEINVGNIVDRLSDATKFVSVNDAAMLIMTSLMSERTEVSIPDIEAALFKWMKNSTLSPQDSLELYKICSVIWKNPEKIAQQMQLLDMFEHVVDVNENMVKVPLWYLFDKRFCSLISPKQKFKL